MKKLFIVLGMILLATSLFACETEETVTYTVDQIIEDLDIIFAAGDSVDSVISNLIFPVTSSLSDTAAITWESGNPSVIDHYGTVNRQLNDTMVTLILSVTVGSNSKQVFIDVTVKGTMIYHTVTIYVNEAESTVLVADGTRLTTPTAPVKEDFIFLGWYTDQTLTTKFVFSTVITSDTSIYAGFRAYVSGTFSYDIYLQNIEDDAYTLLEHITGVEEEGTEVSYDDAYAGFELNTELSTQSGIVSPIQNLSLVAYYDRLTYSVTYIDDGDQYAVEYLKYQAEISQIENPIKEAHEFLGWTVSPISTTYYTFGSQITANITLYAQWEYLDDYVYDGYYQGADGYTGAQLETFLRNLTTTGFVGISYGDSRYILDDTDRDPNNPNNLILVYLGTSVSGAWDLGITWNREHVWPQSLLGVSVDNSYIGVGSDLQNLKPADPAENSSRSNDYFDNIRTAEAYEPRDAVKGDIARILFYMDVRYSQLSLVNQAPSLNQMAMLNVLIQWHEDDPVDSFEMNRNNVIYSYQHNRNPFIDHPEFVDKLYGASLLSVSDEENQPFYTLSYTIEIDVYTIDALNNKKEYYHF